MKLILRDLVLYGIVYLARAVADAVARRLPKGPKPKQVGSDDVQG